VGDANDLIMLAELFVLGMPGSVFKVDLPKKENGVHYNGVCAPSLSCDFCTRKC
jgi:hypothetical protein